MSFISENKITEEQNLCIQCGFCCDGTLFNRASLNTGEKGTLPEKLEENYFTIKDKEFFRLPCPYFKSKCSIYYKEKAIICGDYRCQLLKDLSVGKISFQDATQLIKNAKEKRDELLKLYALLSVNNNNLSFYHLLLELHESQAKRKLTPEFKILFGRFIILDSLFTKHFRSSKNFENSMISLTD